MNESKRNKLVVGSRIVIVEDHHNRANAPIIKGLFGIVKSPVFADDEVEVFLFRYQSKVRVDSKFIDSCGNRCDYCLDKYICYTTA
jgi:hypothetical protein